MKILQALPALHSGGVERGTVEFARQLAHLGHSSYVVSSGGPLADMLEQEGSTHITLPIHRKSLASFGQILPMVRLLKEVQPDILHVRSRMPAWIIQLALKALNKQQRPAIITSFHGMYSVGPYSAVMAKADHSIAVSNCVKDYVINNFSVPEQKITVIQRGVDVNYFRKRPPSEQWHRDLLLSYPHLNNKRILMMPGRITRWKGQLQFLEVMAELIQKAPVSPDEPPYHGIIVGGAEPGKERFLEQLTQVRNRLGLQQHVSFLGQRSDMAELYQLADLVCHLSTKPEPFGRTVTEALASGTPVAAFNRGGAAETLQACFREGLVTPDDVSGFAHTAQHLLSHNQHTIEIPYRFKLQAQTNTTLGVYNKVLATRDR
jgi:glycosyltransferase involved in cell wall biosynthesis